MLKEYIVEFIKLAQYSDAGKKAQPELKEAINRFKNMAPEARGDQVLLYWLLGAGTPDYKMSQEEAKYEAKSEHKSETCGNCAFAYQKVIDKRFICSQMRGDIKPEAWCKLWRK